MRQKMGFLFQNAALFDSISVGENVAFPMRRHTRMERRGDPDARHGEARGRRSRAGIRQDARRRSRAACGSAPGSRARSRSIPRILLVDEPSAGLDPITADEIDELLLELKQGGGVTLVVVTHNIPSARSLGDQLLMLHEGRVVAEGTPDGPGPQRQRAGARLHDVTARGVNEGMARNRLVAVGAFVIFGVLLFAVGLFFIGNRRMLFDETFERLRGVREYRRAAERREGARRRHGRRRSRRRFRCRPARRAKFRVKMRIREDLHPLIRVDSVAIIQTDGLVGNKFVQVDAGTDQAADRAGRRDDAEPRAVRLSRDAAAYERLRST